MFVQSVEDLVPGHHSQNVLNHVVMEKRIELEHVINLHHGMVVKIVQDCLLKKYIAINIIVQVRIYDEFI